MSETSYKQEGTGREDSAEIKGIVWKLADGDRAHICNIILAIMAKGGRRSQLPYNRHYWLFIFLILLSM